MKNFKGGTDKLLFGAMNFPIRPIFEELESISELGFDYMEVAMDPPQAHFRMIQEHQEELLRSLERHRMGIICHLPTFVSTADLTKSIRESSLKETLGSLEVAADLGALKVVLHPSIIGGLGVFIIEQAREYAMSSLEAVVERADQLGVVLCLENMFPRSNSLVEPGDFLEVFKKFSNLKMTLDTGHAKLGSPGDKRALEFIKNFADRIDHIHANDNLGKEDNHLPIGTGTIDFEKIVMALKGIGYDGTITLEVFSRDRDYLRMSKEKLGAMFESL